MNMSVCVELVTTAHLGRLGVEPAVLLELLRRNRCPRVASQLVVKAVNVCLEARGVDRPPMRRPHCRAEYVRREQSLVHQCVREWTYISCGVKRTFSRAWFHIFRRFPALFFLLYRRA